MCHAHACKTLQSANGGKSSSNFVEVGSTHQPNSISVSITKSKDSKREVTQVRSSFTLALVYVLQDQMREVRWDNSISSDQIHQAKMKLINSVIDISFRRDIHRIAWIKLRSTAVLHFQHVVLLLANSNFSFNFAFCFLVHFEHFFNNLRFTCPLKWYLKSDRTRHDLGKPIYFAPVSVHNNVPKRSK